MGAYSMEVCSKRMAPVATTMSPDLTSRSMPPQVPVRMKVSAPSLCSSSMAMEGADADGDAQQRAGVGGVLAVLRDQLRVVEVRRDGRTATRIAGKNDVAAHFTGGAVDVILTFQLLHDDALP